MSIDTRELRFSRLGWLAALTLIAIGILNFLWIHAIPAMVYLLLSLIYLPPANELLRKRFGLHIPAILKLALAAAIFFFTLGVSDLGEMVDRL